MSHILTPLRYTTSSDIGMRLKGTLVKWLGKLVYVEQVMPDLIVKVVDPITQTYYNPHSSDSRLDISIIPIGWVNYSPPGSSRVICTYLFREPRNSQRQGIVPGNLATMTIHDGAFFSEGFHFDTISDLIPLAKAVANDYPSFEDAVSLCLAPHRRKTRNSIAFSQEWAMVERKGFVGVYHKSMPVALYYPSSRRFVFKRGSLTKTRRASLSAALQEGMIYDITES